MKCKLLKDTLEKQNDTIVEQQAILFKRIMVS